jgi:MarR family transcriptional regulator, organic hydroperoxide resistance regulator
MRLRGEAINKAINKAMSRVQRTARTANGSIRRVGNNAASNAPYEERFAHLVKLAARGLARALQMRLTEHAVSYGHWTFLRILWQEEGLTQRELSARAGVMEPTTFAALKAMARRGYVTRRRNPQSRKEMQVLLTSQGRALQAKLVPLAEDVNDIALRGVGAADMAATRRTLLALINNLSADERAAPTLRRIPSTRELAQLARRTRTGRRVR